MSRHFVADLDHLIETPECSDHERLWSVRRDDRLQDHPWTVVNLSEVRQKRAAEVGVKVRHLLRVAEAEAFKRKNPPLVGPGITDGRETSQAAEDRHA